MEQNDIELYKLFHEGQGKYFYFLLAFTASAIVYVLNLLNDRILEWSLIPVAIAIICWIISLYLGIIWIQYRNSAMMDNYELLQTKNNVPRKTPTDPTEYAAKIEVLYEVFENKSNKCAILAKWQLRFIILGIIFFVLWYVLEMSLRTINS